MLGACSEQEPEEMEGFEQVECVYPPRFFFKTNGTIMGIKTNTVIRSPISLKNHLTPFPCFLPIYPYINVTFIVL